MNTLTMSISNLPLIPVGVHFYKKRKSFSPKRMSYLCLCKMKAVQVNSFAIFRNRM